MSKKEEIYKEKIKQALNSTFKVISESLVDNSNNKKAATTHVVTKFVSAIVRLTIVLFLENALSPDKPMRGAKRMLKANTPPITPRRVAGRSNNRFAKNASVST